MLKATLSTVLELVGAASIVAGCWLVAPWLALIVGGVALMAVAVVLGRPS